MYMTKRLSLSFFWVVTKCFRWQESKVNLSTKPCSRSHRKAITLHVEYVDPSASPQDNQHLYESKRLARTTLVEFVIAVDPRLLDPHLTQTPLISAQIHSYQLFNSGCGTRLFWLARGYSTLSKEGIRGRAWNLMWVDLLYMTLAHTVYT